MENATQALLMAGGVLIGVLILTLAVFLFTDFGSTASQIQSQVETNRLVEFNAQYTVYVSKTDTTIYDVVSIANKAKENNDNYKEYGNYSSDYKITISIAGESGSIQDYDSTKMERLLKADKYGKINDKGELAIRFKCTETYHDNGRIESLTFTSYNV